MDVRATRPTEHPRRRWQALYAIFGGVTAAFGVLNGLGPLQGSMSGCSLSVAPLGWRIAGSSSCRYALDLLPVVLPLAAGIVMVIAAWRYFHSGSISTAMTAIAIPTAIIAAAYPLYAVWWLVDYYRLSVGVTEAVMMLIALAVLGIALLAGWVTARYLLMRHSMQPKR